MFLLTSLLGNFPFFPSNFSFWHPSARRNSKRSQKEKYQRLWSSRMATRVEGRKFYELISRNKSGDRSSNELRRVDGRRYGPGVANATVIGNPFSHPTNLFDFRVSARGLACWRWHTRHRELLRTCVSLSVLATRRAFRLRPSTRNVHETRPRALPRNFALKPIGRKKKRSNSRLSRERFNQP